MSDNVEAKTNLRLINTQPEVDETTVKALEEWVHRVESGEVRGIAVIACTTDGGCLFSVDINHSNPWQLLGAIEDAKLSLLDYINSHSSTTIV